MKKEIDCQVFGDQLDSLQDGTLPAEGQRQLRLHAASCPDCAMSLRVMHHLGLPALEELEASVPDDLLAGIWPGVEAGLESRGDSRMAAGGESAARISRETRTESSSPRKSHGWLVPTLAAASVTLLLTTGLLFSEWRKAETQGARMAARIEDLQREFPENGANAEWIQRTAELAGNRRTRVRALDFALAGQENVTVSSLLELLEEYPPDMVLFEASQIDNLLGSPVRPPPELRRLFSALANALTLDDVREVRAGELANWLASSGLPQDMTVPKTPLIDLLS